MYAALPNKTVPESQSGEDEQLLSAEILAAKDNGHEEAISEDRDPTGRMIEDDMNVNEDISAWLTDR